MRCAFLAWLSFGLVLTGSAQTLRGSMAGKVLDSEGQGLSANVHVYQQKAVDGIPYLQQRCLVVSDSSGLFNCPPIAAGKYFVEESPIDPNRKQEGGSGEIAASSFYPGVSDLAEAKAIRVTPERAGWAYIQEPTYTPVSISGRLIPSAPEAAFTLETTTNGWSTDTGILVSYDGKTGTFKAQGLMPGQYLLEADWLVNNFEHLAFVPITLGTESIKNLEVTPLANTTIVGQITGVTAGSRVSRILLRRVDGLLPPLSSAVNNGSFEFDNVPGGEYFAEPVLASDEYVDSVSIDGQTTDGARFQINEEKEDTMQVSLNGPACEVEGNVAEWDGNGKADVVAVSEETGRVYHVLTDSQRRFSIHGLRPGSYRLFAWPQSDMAPYRVASFRKRYQSDSVEVTVEQATVEQQVSLTAAE